MKQQIGDRMTERRWYAEIMTRCRMYSVPTGLYNDAQTKCKGRRTWCRSVSRVRGQQDPKAPEVQGSETRVAMIGITSRSQIVLDTFSFSFDQFGGCVMRMTVRS